MRYSYLSTLTHHTRIPFKNGADNVRIQVSINQLIDHFMAPFHIVIMKSSAYLFLLLLLVIRCTTRRDKTPLRSINTISLCYPSFSLALHICVPDEPYQISPPPASYLQDVQLLLSTRISSFKYFFLEDHNYSFSFLVLI